MPKIRVIHSPFLPGGAFGPPFSSTRFIWALLIYTLSNFRRFWLNRPLMSNFAMIYWARKKVSIWAPVTSSGTGFLSTMRTFLRMNVVNGLKWIFSKVIWPCIFSERFLAALFAIAVCTCGSCTVIDTANTNVRTATIVSQIIFNAFLITYSF